MACEIVLASSFPGLMDRLLADLCRSRALDPRWVLVPTSTLANAIRIRLGQEAARGALAGIRVLPLLSFLRRLAAFDGATPAQRWGPELDLTLFELVEQLEAPSPLADLRTMPAGYRLLRPTFLDLADGGFGPEQAELMREIAAEPDLSPLESEALLLYVRWIDLIERRGAGWEPLEHQKLPDRILGWSEAERRAALACEQDQKARLFIYGFYDFTDVNAQCIASLGRSSDLRILFPMAGTTHPVFAFAAAVLEDLQVRLGTALDGPTVEPESRRNPVDFFLSSFPDGEVSAQPRWLTCQKASGLRAEAVSAAVRVREWLDDRDQPLAPEEVMVLAPDAGPYAGAVADVFEAFAIPLRVVDVPVGISPRARPLQLLCRVWESRGEAEWVLALLRECPRLTRTLGVNLERFEFRVRRLGIWGGPGWEMVEKAEKERDRVEFSSEERALAAEIRSTWGDPAGREQSFTCARGAQFLRRVASRWLSDPEPLGPLVEALETLTAAAPRLKIREGLLREMVLSAVGEEVQTDPLEKKGVLFAPLMRARGLASRALVVLGLSSENLPARIHEDPLLSDDARARLVAKARDVGHRLPIKFHVADEMALLFYLANTSAERVHWVIPECDEGGRTVAPTPWVQRYLHHWQGGARPRILRGPAQQADYLLASRPGGELIPPAFLLTLKPALAPRLPAGLPYGSLWQRLRLRAESPEWNGVMPLVELPAARLEQPRFRVTELEDLARCPFRFFARHQGGWEGVEPLRFEDELNPMAWGSLVHGALELLFTSRLQTDQSVSEIAAEFLDEVRLQELIESVSREFEVSLGSLPEVFRRAALRRLTSTVQSYLRSLLEEGRERPEDVESRKSRPFPGMEGFQISGRIDRVDRGGGRFQVYDYKSGREPEAKDIRRDVRLGYRLQPALYPWLLQVEEGTRVDFSYVFLGGDSPRRYPCRRRDDVEGLLEPLARVVRDRKFLPLPNETMDRIELAHAEPCRFCEFMSLCRRFDPGARSRYLRMGREHLAARLNWLAREGRKES